MREAIGTSFVLNFVLVFIAIFIFFFVGTLSYTKAFKVKNKIIDTIENYDGEICSGNCDSSEFLDNGFTTEINTKLKEIGYRVGKNDCENARFENGTILSKTITGAYNKDENYRYCIYKFSTSKGNYFGVVSYMYFELPIIGVSLEFPVYGETKVFTEISKG